MTSCWFTETMPPYYTRSVVFVEHMGVTYPTTSKPASADTRLERTQRFQLANLIRSAPKDTPVQKLPTLFNSSELGNRRLYSESSMRRLSCLRCAKVVVLCSGRLTTHNLITILYWLEHDVDTTHRRIQRVNRHGSVGS